MTALQAFLICKPPIISHILPQSTRLRFHKHASFNSNHRPSPNSPKTSRFLCALHNVDASSDLTSSSNDNLNSVPELGHDFRDGKSSIDAAVGELGTETEESKGNIPFLVFLMGFFARMRSRFEKTLLSDWLNWWPFTGKEKRLAVLIAEADANPNDALKQSALLVELNKHKLKIKFL